MGIDRMGLDIKSKAWKVLTQKLTRLYDQTTLRRLGLWSLDLLSPFAVAELPSVVVRHSSVRVISFAAHLAYTRDPITVSIKSRVSITSAEQAGS
ncbi:hypothetical protein KQX54_006508 [Cotesia glomerata]|uniref:Uncharacterized protein n=1 Tax=Cotesia glomerata TaxID=32391 RepID=A0AAV7J2N4_COTGL|nr:hypothetical protein KQX54_006508 [Cotesia glomerata]